MGFPWKGSASRGIRGDIEESFAKLKHSRLYEANEGESEEGQEVVTQIDEENEKFIVKIVN